MEAQFAKPIYQLIDYSVDNAVGRTALLKILISTNNLTPVPPGQILQSLTGPQKTNYEPSTIM